MRKSTWLADDVMADATVLRHAAFGNVQVRHDFEARNHRQRQVLRRRRHFIQRAVHAVADAEFRFKRLEMDVARPVRMACCSTRLTNFTMGTSLARFSSCLSSSSASSTSRAMSVSAPSSLRISEKLPLFVLAVKPVNHLLDFRRIGHAPFACRAWRQNEFHPRAADPADRPAPPAPSPPFSATGRH